MVEKGICMNFLKNTLLGIFFLYAMYWGGVGTQSDSTFTQGMGFVSVVMAIVSLYILYKLLPKILSSVSTMLILACIILYSAYCLGFFNGKTIDGFMIGKESTNTSEAEQYAADDIDFMEDGGENTEDTGPKKVHITPQTSAQSNNVPQQQTSTAAEDRGLIGKVKEVLFGKQQEQSATGGLDINPLDYPSVTGKARVITGSLLKVQGITIKLFGIASPDLRQTCADKHGAGYYCGRSAATWLRNWLGDKEVTCHILGDVVRNRATGSCFVNDYKYDLAAVVTNAGWAVAYTKITQVYIPYEQQAAQNHRGLWKGEFYKPWDWEKIQNRKVEIQIHTPEQKSSSKGWGLNMNMFKGLF